MVDRNHRDPRMLDVCACRKYADSGLVGAIIDADKDLLHPMVVPTPEPTSRPTGNRKLCRIGAGSRFLAGTGGTIIAGVLPTIDSMSVMRVPTGADRHMKVPTCADRDRRGRRLRGAVPPVPRGFVDTKFAVQGYFEVCNA
jgi:hypothetical protein